MQPPQQPSISADLAEIRQFKRDIDANLAKSEEILGLANARLQTALTLLKKAQEDRDKVQTERAEVVKIAKGLRVKEEKLKIREDNLMLNQPFASGGFPHSSI